MYFQDSFNLTVIWSMIKITQTPWLSTFKNPNSSSTILTIQDPMQAVAFTILLNVTACLNQAEKDFEVFKTSVLGSNIILVKASLVGRSQYRQTTKHYWKLMIDGREQAMYFTRIMTTKPLAKIQNWVSNSNCVRKLLTKFSRRLQRWMLAV